MICVLCIRLTKWFSILVVSLSDESLSSCPRGGGVALQVVRTTDLVDLLTLVQWNLSIMVTLGPDISGLYNYADDWFIEKQLAVFYDYDHYK